MRRLVPVGLVFVAVFYAVALTRGTLNQGDWGRHWHYYDWTRTSLRQFGTLPFFMCDASHTPDFVANAQSPIFGPFVWLLFFLSTDAYIKLLILVYSLVGFVSMMALARDFGVTTLAALPFAVLFTFNGYFVSHICLGHHWVLGSYLLPAIVLAFRRANRGSSSAIWVAAACNVLSILEGQHHPFLWNTLFLLVYAIGSSALEQRAWRPVQLWFKFLAASVLLGAIRLMPMASDFRGYAPEARFPAIPIDRLGSVLWQNLFTAAEAAQTGFPPPYRFTRGLAAFDVGWWEYDFYLGIAGASLFAFCLVWLAGRRPFDRRAAPWLTSGVLFLIVSLKTQPGGFEPWSWIQDLPLVSSQRIPSRFLIVAVTAFSVAAALGLQSAVDALDSVGRRWVSVALRACLAAASLLIFVDLYRTALPLELHSVGAKLEPLTHRFGESPGRSFAELQYFSPNVLVYANDERVAANDTQSLRLPLPDKQCYVSRAVVGLPMPGPRQLLSEWVVDGGTSAIVDGQWLAVRVAPGTREVVVRYRPRYFWTGALLSGLTAAIVLTWAAARLW